MCKFNPKNDSRKIDPCMKYLIRYLQNMNVPTLACCCGHGKYNMTIIVKFNSYAVLDIVSGKEIPRKRRFYKKDKQGYYFIPEVVDGKW